MIEYNGFCYEFFDIGMTWHEAKEYCEKLGGYLAVVKSRKEQKIVKKLISMGNRKIYWLGGTCEHSVGNWKWVTGEPWKYENWAPGEPNCEFGKEFFLLIYNYTAGSHRPFGKWNDADFDGSIFFWPNEKGFICQWNSLENYRKGTTSEFAQTRLPRAENKIFKKELEEKYGYKIIIENSILDNNFYLAKDSQYLEFKVLKEIENAFSMLPDGFVREVTKHQKRFGNQPSIVIRKRNVTDAPSANHVWDYNIIKKSPINHVQAKSAIFIREDIIGNLLHEFCHEIALTLKLLHLENPKVVSDKLKIAESFFLTKNKDFPYDLNYQSRDTSNERFFDIYFTKYASSEFWEDFADTFVNAIIRAGDVNACRNGIIKPIHEKINMIGAILSQTFVSIKDSDFLLKH